MNQTMTFAVISYPKFIPNEGELIPVMESLYPKLIYPKLAPHFTVVFPQGSVAQESLVEHVKTIAANHAPIPFVIRRVEAVADKLSQNHYLFLVPDEGFEPLMQLHDDLYGGLLAHELRVDIPFLPHITLGYTPDAAYCETAADAINAQPFEVRGMIEMLDVVEIESDTARTVTQVKLGG
jgi:2'-5' RNA ligase